MGVRLVEGVPDEFVAQATAVFWQGFAEMLHHALGDEVDARDFLSATFEPDAVTLAVAGNEVLGVVAFSDAQHEILSETWAAARDVYGPFQGVWRLLMMLPLSVSPPPDTLYIEYLAVSPAARGRGVGSLLMEHAEDIARHRGLTAVTLDVVDTNVRARALYERLGYRVVETLRMGMLSRLYGFAASHRMEKSVADEAVDR